MNTIGSRTHLIYSEIADEVLTLLDDFGFYTDTSFDPSELKNKIVKSIQEKIEGKQPPPQRRDLNLEEANNWGKTLWESN